MPFSTDRDLLAIEPNLFADLPLLAALRASVSDGVVSGTTLTSAAADFAAAQVGAGSVVLVGSAPTPVEVLARVDAHTLTVSRMRTMTTDAAIPPGDGSSLAVVARSFMPQGCLVCDTLMALLGEDATTDAVLSPAVMARLEVLGTLERLYTAAVALVGDNDTLWRKAAYYRDRFAAACRQAVVLLDLDGDGQADARRTLGAIKLSRV